MQFFFTALGWLVWIIIALIAVGILFLFFCMGVYVHDQKKEARDKQDKRIKELYPDDDDKR